TTGKIANLFFAFDQTTAPVRSSSRVGVSSVVTNSPCRVNAASGVNLAATGFSQSSFPVAASQTRIGPAAPEASLTVASFVPSNENPSRTRPGTGRLAIKFGLPNAARIDVTTSPVAASQTATSSRPWEDVATRLPSRE